MPSLYPKRYGLGLGVRRERGKAGIEDGIAFCTDEHSRSEWSLVGILAEDIPQPGNIIRSCEELIHLVIHSDWQRLDPLCQTLTVPLKKKKPKKG